MKIVTSGPRGALRSLCPSVCPIGGCEHACNDEADEEPGSFRATSQQLNAQDLVPRADCS